MHCPTMPVYKPLDLDSMMIRGNLIRIICILIYRHTKRKLLTSVLQVAANLLCRLRKILKWKYGISRVRYFWMNFKYVIGNWILSSNISPTSELRDKFTNALLLIFSMNSTGEIISSIDTHQVNNSYAAVSPCGRFVASSGMYSLSAYVIDRPIQ